MPLPDTIHQFVLIPHFFFFGTSTWRPNSLSQNIFNLDYGMQVDIIVLLKAKQIWSLLAPWLVSFLLCIGDQSIRFTDFDDMDPSIGVNLRGLLTLHFPNCDPLPKSV